MRNCSSWSYSWLCSLVVMLPISLGSLLSSVTALCQLWTVFQDQLTKLGDKVASYLSTCTKVASNGSVQLELDTLTHNV